MLSMIKSIQQFQEKGVTILEKVLVDYSADMTQIAEMVYGVRDSMLDLGRSIIAEELETYDEWLRNSARRKQEWQIVRRDETSLLTCIGSVTYHKTLFKHKNTGASEYLLDRAMGLEKHTRMTEDAVAKVLEEAVDTSYRKGGENASITSENVSKQTVMNKIHQLKFPEPSPLGEKKTVNYLYVDADEDHVSLQYLEKKGDIGKRRRINTVMPKIVYVYEGITNENGRNELINVKYFGGVYEGSKGNQSLWNEVFHYIEKSYDLDSLKGIYINGDGALWIKNGVKYLPRAKFVLDRFHMHKYIVAATSHLKDSIEDARSEMYRAIHRKRKWMMEEVFDKILSVTEEESRHRAVENAQRYILGNWAGIMEQIRNKDKQLECSAEGHVSHIYADRMSSRPLGWSLEGADQMARLRIYKSNHGDMLELVRYQSEEKAAGAEEIIFSCEDVLRSERENRARLRKLPNTHVYSIPYTHVKKIANFKSHIYGL